MATKKSDTLSKAELNDLKEAGYVEGQANTIPLNISPVLRAKVLASLEENQEGVEGSSYIDKPTADERQNQLVRERAAADGDEDMQKLTGVEEGAETGKRQGK